MSTRMPIAVALVLVMVGSVIPAAGFAIGVAPCMSCSLR